MNSTVFENKINSYLPTNPNDLLNILRDDNFPQCPPPTQKNNKSPRQFRKIYGSVNFIENLSESLHLSQVLPLSDRSHQKQRKKKRVVFREEIADYCSTSPQMLMPHEMKAMLSKTAEKGILMKKNHPSNIDILMGTKVNEASNSDSSQIIEYRDYETNKTKDNKELGAHETNEEIKIKKEQIIPFPLDMLDLDNESLNTSFGSSSENEERSKAFAGSTPKSSSKGKFNRPVDLALATPFNSEIEKGLSMSEVLPTVALVDPRKNQSSIAGSLNDLPLNSDPNSVSVSETSLNDVDFKIKGGSQSGFGVIQKPSPRVRITKYRENSSISVDIPNNIIEKTLPKAPSKNGLSSFAPSQTFLNDLKVQNRPVINTQNSLVAALNKGNLTNQGLKKTDTLIKSLNQNSGKAFSMNNLDSRKIQTPSNNHIIIKTNSTPKAKSKALLPLEIPQNSIDTSIIRLHKEHHNNSLNGENIDSITGLQLPQNIASDTFCIKDGNKIIWYSLKEKRRKVVELDQSLGLEGCAFCKTSDETVIISGGVESRNSSNKLVSSRVSRVNLIQEEKENLQGMPIARYNHALIALGKNVYAVGGQSFDGKVLKSCYMLDQEKNSWLRIPSMRYERINPVAFASNKTGSIYVIGGVDSEGNEIPWIEKFDHKKCSWQLVYNTSRLNFNTKDATLVLGSITNNERSSENNSLCEEIFILVKSNVMKNGFCKYSLFSFDTEKEVLQRKTNFQYEVNESQVMGFIHKENLYLTEKGEYNIMDVYVLNKQTWNQTKFASIN